jgi:DNA-binding transcriptional LysR family regulator
MTNLSGVDLNLLRVLDALLRDRSTVKAGQRIGLSQPAVSAALGRLRAALGDELFFRRGQGLEPTARALALEAPLAEALDRIAALIAPPGDFDPATSATRFRLSGSDFFAEMLMPALAARLGATAPRMLVHLVDLVPDNYVETLDTYEVDIALIPRVDPPAWVRQRVVFHAGFSVIARAGHPRLARAGLAAGDTIPIDLFCDLGHVLFSPEGNARAMGDTALAQVGRSRRVVMSMPVFSGVYRAVAGSDLIALLPTALARRIAPVVGLEIYAAPMPIPRVELAMVWHRRADADPAHRWMRDQIAELLSGLDEGPGS